MDTSSCRFLIQCYSRPPVFTSSTYINLKLYYYLPFIPNTAVESLKIILHIQEVLG
jgi:hypothetical protein